ncbi:MAG: exopolysaccharide biosynthesis polyprenyl glycosylphosphotransferase [bacterium]|nr:exopolysaccharide biosynthesis polyprenyl glycosylphosphotransferase [bacterium]
MSHINKKEALLLFLGDIVIFVFSLWLTLYIRYFEFPTTKIFSIHIVPFSILFAVWILVFFIAGLYEKHTVILKSRLPSIILNAQALNSVIAVLFFYFIPLYGIAPKTNLFIYLVISFLLILLWRIYIFALFGARHRQNAILVGRGQEMLDLRQEVNNNSRYNLKFISSVNLDDIGGFDFKEEIVTPIYSENVSVIAVDLQSEQVEPILPMLYNLIFSKIRFIDMHKIYEDIFDRIPLSLVKYSWFLENISLAPKSFYDTLKRLMDVVLAFVLSIISLPFYPLVWLLIKLDDGDKLFFVQERVGKNNRNIKIVKFRSMSAEPDLENTNNVTRVGKYLRASRIDELPQLWNVLKGDLSLIGPRPELPGLVRMYEKEIPYYNVRHLIQPGLSGWAQLYHRTPPKFDVGYDETRMKLSYDLYYIKNRSFLLDLKIALKTLKTLLMRSGI